ncbi:MAG: exodeoxyribonuclease V subunit gamma [Methylomicrobium sp.]
MFILHSSNKTENLLEHLTAVITNQPLSSPFAKEVFLIQSQGMERWLSQQLAGKLGVWGHFEFLFPSRFFSTIAQRIDSRLNDEAFDRNKLLWRLEALLRRLDSNVFKPLEHYLNGEDTALKRFQLATQLASIFDQYQIMRPELLVAWQRNESVYDTDTEHWQRALWQRLTEAIGTKHRGGLWLDVIAKLNDAPEYSFADALPERISVFGVNTMPPLFLAFLQGLARHVPLHLYLLNPAQTFWADLATKRQRIDQEDSTGHPLLSALGQQGREFQEMLLEQVSFELELDSFEPGEAESNLSRLQNDILNNETPTTELIADGSITVHACHSRMREVEVLKDQLLQALENDPSLELRDIVVMAPDIEIYEPFISAVFDDIQHAVADRSLRLSNHALDALIGFLKLGQSRFGWQTVLDLLERPAVYPGFGLSETDLELIKHWIRDTEVRWGRSAEHRSELGLPAFDENSWRAALDRLLMGYAVGQDQVFIDGILPYIDVEGSMAGALGGFDDFLQLLFKAGNDLKTAKPLKIWGERLYHYADQLLAAADSNEREQINELLTELGELLPAIHDDPVDWQVICAWLEGRIEEHKSSTGFLRGQLTFCSMLPMRSIPFQVIALLGLNDSEFPKIDRRPTFDLLAADFRKGDRSRRADDRYQFLEILLSARRQLLITYIGQSLDDNASIPPSVVVSELLEVLQSHYRLTDIVVKHPLQAFSPRYFEASEDLFSFSQTDCQTACALSKPKSDRSLWWSGELAIEQPETDETVIDLDELLAFYRHPQRYFLNRCLGLRFDAIAADAEEREPFALDQLNAYTIYHEWLDTTLHDRPLSVQKLKAQGRWLSGVAGDIEFTRQQRPIDAFADSIRSKHPGEALEELSVDLRIGRFRLVGKLGCRYRNGSLFYRYAALKGKDFIAAWLHHLLINRIESQKTWLLALDADLLFEADDCALGDLDGMLALYSQGLRRPDAFFVEPAFAYIKQAVKLAQSRRASKPALAVAIEQLDRAMEQPYEAELQKLFGAAYNAQALLDETFEERCRELLLPAWERVQQRQ